MSIKGVQDILGLVQKPSRYLGTEVNSVHKEPGSTPLKVVLAFPDLYEIGTSHFGVQILYHLLNQHEHISAERVFAPARDMQELLRQNRLPLFSLESQQPVAYADIIGFSLLYELNYTNVLNMLDLAGLPLRWAQRDNSHPFIIAGGPCVCNPEPMAEFFDAMVFGDGEGVFLEMAEQWLAWKAAGRPDKIRLLKQWSQLEGVYVPRFYRSSHDGQGFQHLAAARGVRPSISRAILPDLDRAYFPEKPIIPFGKPVHDRLRIEISRGCSRACRFCQAGMLYRPVRERSAHRILELVRTSLDHTGYEDLSLLSLSTGDYTCLAPLMENLVQVCHGDRVAVSLPSLRAGSLTPKLMKLIRSIRKTGFTIAPEAGSQRLRDVINKNITYDDVAATVRDAFELGWRVIKLYFMIGLPTETEEDLDAIVDVVGRLKRIKSPQGRSGQINVSITTFVPKPHTPFQWAGQLTLGDSRQKIDYLKSRLNISGVRLKWQNPEMSLLEGILARGDRRLAAVIAKAWESGCIFDGWNDQFDFGRWRKALEQCGVDADFFTTRLRHLDESLPWSHMDCGVDPDFLKKQWNDLGNADRVDDCRNGNCHGCGICDFDRIQPRVFDACPAFCGEQPAAGRQDQGDDFVWLVLRYSKLGQARYFGHLEMGRIFSRAVRRAKIGVQYSKGFHPLPRLSFDDPLPLGMASEAEQMRIMVSSKTNCGQVVQRLNAYLPQGLRILDCRPKSTGKKEPEPAIHRYDIDLGGIQVDIQIIQRFLMSDEWLYVRSRANGAAHTIDLKAMVKTIDIHRHNGLYMEIQQDRGLTVRPGDFLAGVLDLRPEVLQKVLVTKLAPAPENCGSL
jgi:radical SAM family uncharacterized protein/radical SAM-linked protein